MASVQEAEQIVRGLTGKLAKRIYESGARFVFDLVLNADRKAFSNVLIREAFPFLSFKIHPNFIIVDCNDDKFTKSDLEAICAARERNEGTKGIDFKPIFSVAPRVHIQSGNFSFELRDDKIDTDTGTMRPNWVPPIETIPDHLNRMTLHLHDQGDEEGIEHLMSAISTQFDKLQETSLLFLSKLQQITIEFYDEGGKLDRSKQFRKRQIDKYRVSLETITINGGEEIIKDQIYHVTKLVAMGLAPRDQSEPPQTGLAEVIPEADVVLAFPLSIDYKPLVTQRTQKVFALSPIRTSNYNFHIHSDFDVNADGQDIITTSKKNLGIRVWIVTAFRQAISQFCEHPTLCYDWPLFLPSQETDSGGFWSNLNHDIRDMVMSNPVLKGRKWDHLRHIRDVVVLSVRAQDKDGQPLFDDPAKDVFLSSKYTATAVDILIEYGLRRILRWQFLDLLETDLSSNESRMRGEDTADEWHSTVAERLWDIWEKNPSFHRRLQSLPLLPLRDGTWTSTKTGPVYLPTTNAINIPESLNIRTLSLSAFSNPHRLTFFKGLGVSEAAVDQVRESIMESFASTDLSLGNIRDYLHYLYLTHRTGIHTREGYSRVQVMDHCGGRVSPHDKIVYLSGTDHSYSPESLWFTLSKSSDLSACLLHLGLLNNGPAQPNIFHPPWKTWLCASIGLRERLSLLTPGGDALSETFLYILEHRPNMFLGFIDHLWKHDMAELLKNQALVTQIQNLPAKGLCGVNFAIRLKDTWLPFENLKKIVERYMEHPGQFPFLKVEGGMDRSIGTKWNFLSQYLSVGNFENMDLLLEVLRCIRKSRPESQKVFGLYVAISSKLALFGDQEVMQRKIRDVFEDGAIFAPYEDEPRWTNSSSCLWAAPSGMVTMNALQSLYKRQNLNDGDMKSIENLFHKTLGIRDATMNHLVNELNALRETDCHDLALILHLYRYLDKEITASTDMRTAFEESPLIFVEQQGVLGWYTTSDCFWSGTIALRGKVTLGNIYGELEDFFVNKLGVMSLTPQVVYDELCQSSQRNIEETKMDLFTLNGFLETAPLYLDPEPVRKAKVFPVRNPDGTVVLRSIDMDFAIGDRDMLRTKFEDKISLLDFDLRDVRRLRPLFEWLRLQDRYLSRCVKESTSISSDVEIPISSSKRDLKCKAYHITRVAATFNSPRFQDNASVLYDKLRTLAVVEVDAISSVLKISQNGQTIEVNMANGSEHFAEFAGKLTIYVLRERKAQEISFGSVLPRKLAAWLMRDRNVEAEAVNVLTSILASERYVLDDILDDQGIIHVPFENKDKKGEDDDEDEDENEIFYNALEPGEKSS